MVWPYIHNFTTFMSSSLSIALRTASFENVSSTVFGVDSEGKFSRFEISDENAN